jgi:soluble cytochrome b562
VADFGQKPALNYAVAQARQIDPSRQRYSQAQAMVSRWLLQIEQLEDLPYLRRAEQLGATQTVPALQQAIAQAQVIPQQRSLWQQTQSQIVVWQHQIEKIEDQPLMDRALALAKENQLDEAIMAAAEIRPNRALYDQAQSSIATWKDKIRMALLAEDQALLDRAYGLAGSGDITGGIAIAAQLSPGRPLYMEAQSVIGAWLRERDGDGGGSFGNSAAEAEGGSDSETASTETGAGAETGAEASDISSDSVEAEPSTAAASDLSEPEASSEAVE